MRDILRNATIGNVWFHILAAISVILLIASWFVPPMAVIDASVLAAVGELFAFAALGTVIHAINKGRQVKMTHGSTTLAVNKEDEEPAE
jgi:hypothetical protein